MDNPLLLANRKAKRLKSLPGRQKRRMGLEMDSLLLNIRRALRDGPHERFPVKRIESAITRAGKALTFSAEEIDELLDSQ